MDFLKPEPTTRKGLSLQQAYSKLFNRDGELREKFEEQYPEFKNVDDDDSDEDGVESESGSEAEALRESRKQRKKAEAKQRSQRKLKYWNRFTGELYQAAPDDVKARVEEFRQQFKEGIIEKAANIKAELAKEATDRTPEELHRYVVSINLSIFYSSLNLSRYRAIESVHHTIQPMADTIAANTGLNAFICLGGPMPEQEGKIGFIQ